MTKEDCEIFFFFNRNIFDKVDFVAPFLCVSLFLDVKGGPNNICRKVSLEKSHDFYLQRKEGNSHKHGDSKAVRQWEVSVSVWTEKGEVGPSQGDEIGPRFGKRTLQDPGNGGTQRGPEPSNSCWLDAPCLPLFTH